MASSQIMQHTKTEVTDFMTLANKKEKCPLCGAELKRRELRLVQIGSKWDIVWCPKCKRNFGIIV